MPAVGEIITVLPACHPYRHPIMHFSLSPGREGEFFEAERLLQILAFTVIVRVGTPLLFACSDRDASGGKHEKIFTCTGGFAAAFDLVRLYKTE